MVTPIPRNSDWSQVDSVVYRPESWLILSCGGVFLLIGAIGIIAVENAPPADVPIWLSRLLFAVFALVGTGLAVSGVRMVSSPTMISHAGPNVLSDVPSEPVLLEGSAVHGRLSHEFIETDAHWQLRPSQKLKQNNTAFLVGFGIPFLIGVCALSSWIIHTQLGLANWPVSVLCGIAVTTLCGGTPFVLIGLLVNSGFRQLSTLTIPRDGSDFELQIAGVPDPDITSPTEGLKWMLAGEMKQMTIPRRFVVAVQLCPWRYAAGETTTWAAQGLLVLKRAAEDGHERLPILLTNDLVGAAQLMQRLANSIQVPYLFCGDAEGWKSEKLRAQHRPPLTMGGTTS